MAGGVGALPLWPSVCAADNGLIFRDLSFFKHGTQFHEY